MKTILITGINGYLGSLLARRYSKDYHVVGLEYSVENLFRLDNCDFKVYESKNGIPEDIFNNHNIDFVIHTATFYGRDQESNSKMLFANTYLPQMLLEKLISLKHPIVFINTDTVLDRLTSSYALTKKQFKDWLLFYSNSSQINVVNLELEHFYGPGTASTNFITLMTKKMLSNEKTIQLTKGEQNRDFLYIDDLLKVYDIMLKKSKGFLYFDEFRAGAGVNTNLKYILEYIKKHTMSTSELDFGALSYRTNELMESHNDISKLSELGWTPKTPIDIGLSNVIQFEKDARKIYKD